MYVQLQNILEQTIIVLRAKVMALASVLISY